MYFPSMNRRIGTITSAYVLCFLLFAFIVSSGATAQCPPYYVFTGEATGDNLGISVASAGDVNNDGYADLIVGASGNDAGGVNAGRAYVFSGKTGDTIHVFTGGAAGEFLGGVVAFAGDLDEDGFDDVIVGLPGSNVFGAGSGRVLVFSGQTGDTILALESLDLGEQFGISVSSAGDVNADGIPDIVVGSALSSGGVPFGRVSVFSGENGGILYVLNSKTPGDRFGVSVASAGDIDTDGFADFMVGSSFRMVGDGHAGQVHVFSGRNGDTLREYTARAINDGFGLSISPAGDVDGDGHGDIIIGVAFDDENGKNAGLAYVFSGRTGDTLHIFHGHSSGDFFGRSVSFAGDLNLDGFDDITIGADGSDANGIESGQVYVFSGKTGDTLHVFTGEAADDRFGFPVASARDVNNDGRADLIVGARLNDAGGLDAGRAYVYSGRPSGAVIHVPADQPTIQAGIDAALPGDTVLVADGTYTGPGNRDIDFGGKNLVLKSENGPEVTIIDAEGSDSDRHRGFYFYSGEDSTAVIDGFTIQGGNAPPGGPIGLRRGGGIRCDSSSSPKIINNTITGNSAEWGGGIYCHQSSPTISANTITRNLASWGGGILCELSSPSISNNIISENLGRYGGGIRCHRSHPTINTNTISGNSARWGGGIHCDNFSNPTISANTISGNRASFGGGGGIYCFNSNPTISANTISGNSASEGGGISCEFNSNPTISANTIVGNEASLNGAGLYLVNNSSPSVENTVFAFNSGSEAIWCDDETSIPTLTCSDVYGNEGGDWVGCIADQANINGNFSADPLFCDTAAGDFHIDGFSPCAAPFSRCGELVGALGVGCDLGFVCGDMNGDSQVNSADMLAIIDFYFYGGAAPFPLGVGNVNCTDQIDLADVMYIIFFIHDAIPELCCLNTPAPPGRQRIYTEQVDIK